MLSWTCRIRDPFFTSIVYVWGTHLMWLMDITHSLDSDMATNLTHQHEPIYLQVNNAAVAMVKCTHVPRPQSNCLGCQTTNHITPTITAGTQRYIEYSMCTVDDSFTSKLCRNYSSLVHNTRKSLMRRAALKRESHVATPHRVARYVYIEYFTLIFTYNIYWGIMLKSKLFYNGVSQQQTISKWWPQFRLATDSCAKYSAYL